MRTGKKEHGCARRIVLNMVEMGQAAACPYSQNGRVGGKRELAKNLYRREFRHPRGVGGGVAELRETY